jgi:hypothetical protein
MMDWIGGCGAIVDEKEEKERKKTETTSLLEKAGVLTPPKKRLRSGLQ